MSDELDRGKTYIVERGTGKVHAGQGLGAGLGVVLKHFADAFTKKLDSPGETSGVFTVQYPEEQLPLPEAYRNFPILLYDDTSGQELCTSCFQCQRVCPPQVIHMAQAKDPATGKPVPAVSEFIIEYDACMSCGLCAEVCPFDAIKMDQTFELATDYHPGLTIEKEALNRPVTYYERLAPTFWQEVKDGALKKLQGNIKRRPGELGIAPQMLGKVPPNPLTPPPAPKPVVEAQAATPAPAAADDKAARLAAIRARNAAKAAGETSEAPAVAAEAAPPADDKAARLAAIRVKNAAKKAAEEASAAPPEAAPTPAAASPELPPNPPAPADDKAARLAAIRAANAAKKAAQQASPGAPGEGHGTSDDAER